MNKIIRILPVIAIVCILFIGCSNNNQIPSLATDSTETTVNDETEMIIQYQLDNFKELVINGNYEIANNYWEENYEFHTNEEAKEYYNYNYAMLCYNEGIYSQALLHFSLISNEFLNTGNTVDTINKEINKFNGVYKSNNLKDTYLCINNGFVDFIFDEVDNEIYYSRMLKKNIKNDNKFVLSIQYDNDTNEKYNIIEVINNANEITIEADKSSSYNNFNGKYTKISSNPPAIKNA